MVVDAEMEASVARREDIRAVGLVGDDVGRNGGDGCAAGMLDWREESGCLKIVDLCFEMT